MTHDNKLQVEAIKRGTVIDHIPAQVGFKLLSLFRLTETDQRISAAVDAHNSAENAHGDIRASVAAMNASIRAIELKFGTNVTKNPFSATFSSLDGLTVTGVWNAEQARVEF